MTETLIAHIEWAVSNAHTWGFILIFILMAIESSFIPFPSEIVLIPAGFLAARSELPLGDPAWDIVLGFLCGLAGSMAGAYINYYLALFVGRPFLYRYGKYLFIKPAVFARAEEIFIKYGEITTFICRLIPVVRQLISLPAGIARMSLGSFSLFTALGAGIWSVILLWIGYYLGTLSEDMTYAELIYKGKDMLREHYICIFLALAALIAVYALIHHLVMKGKGERIEK
ncbi:MAG: DedA family protein [Deltaproteobacteria bacterium]|nr:DedA family protein [Deltaproteobacteria bacterium]